MGGLAFHDSLLQARIWVIFTARFAISLQNSCLDGWAMVSGEDEKPRFYQVCWTLAQLV
ncbi:MAG: hypothetical protein ACI8VW_003339 [bacterium]|jgi:hypothetical protein